jgi:hypothetical protein
VWLFLVAGVIALLVKAPPSRAQVNGISPAVLLFGRQLLHRAAAYYQFFFTSRKRECLCSAADWLSSHSSMGE